MAKNGRPPMKAAREYADRHLRDDYRPEWESYFSEYLTDQGWETRTETHTKWVHNGTGASQGGN